MVPKIYLYKILLLPTPGSLSCSHSHLLICLQTWDNWPVFHLSSTLLLDDSLQHSSLHRSFTFSSRLALKHCLPTSHCNLASSCSPKSASLLSYTFFFFFTYHCQIHCVHYLLNSVYNLLTLSPNWKCHKGDNFCVFCSLIYLKYIESSLVHSRLSQQGGKYTCDRDTGHDTSSHIADILAVWGQNKW